jgi:tetratricopeptide (TPR) repeat protein
MEVLRRRRNDVDALSNLGLIAMQAQDWSRAASLLGTAVRQDPHSPVLRTNLGICLLNQGKPDAAVGQLQEAVRLDPHLLEGQVNLAIALLRLRRFAEAQRYALQALRQAPRDPHIRLLVAGVYRSRGNITRAIAECREALRLDPNFAPAQRALAECERAAARSHQQQKSKSTAPP